MKLRQADRKQAIEEMEKGTQPAADLRALSGKMDARRGDRGIQGNARAVAFLL